MVLDKLGRPTVSSYLGSYQSRYCISEHGALCNHLELPGMWDNTIFHVRERMPVIHCFDLILGLHRIHICLHVAWTTGIFGLIFFFTLNHDLCGFSFLEPLENMEELLELHNGGFVDGLKCLTLVKCCGVNTQREREREHCCHGDVTWVGQAVEHGYFSCY